MWRDSWHAIRLVDLRPRLLEQLQTADQRRAHQTTYDPRQPNANISRGAAPRLDFPDLKWSKDTLSARKHSAALRSACHDSKLFYRQPEAFTILCLQSMMMHG